MPRVPWTASHPLDPTVIAFHGMLRTSDGRPLAKTLAQLHAILSALVVIAARMEVELLAFAVVDSHIHVVVTGSRYRVGEYLRRVELSIHRRVPGLPPFQPAFAKPIHNQSYLQSCVRYLGRQLEHHQVNSVLLLSGTFVWDVVGLRQGNSVTRALMAHLPRLDLDELWSWLGVDASGRESWGQPLGEAELPHLRDAVVRAAAPASPAIRWEGSGACARAHFTPEALLAAVAAVDRSVGATKLGHALGRSRQSIHRMRAQVDGVLAGDSAAIEYLRDWVRAVRWQVRLWERVARRPGDVQVGVVEAPPRSR